MYIPSNKLTINDLPNHNWKAISAFCLTFDVREPVKQDLNLEVDLHNLSISDLRHILYIEQRRYNHFGREPESSVIKKINEILALIKLKIQSDI